MTGESTPPERAEMLAQRARRDRDRDDPLTGGPVLIGAAIVVVVLLGGLVGYGAAHTPSTGGADAHAASAERTGCAAAAAVSPTPSLEDSIMADAFDRAGSGLDQQLGGDVANFRRALDPASRRLALDAIRGRCRALHEG